jgi:LPS export ABC transporter permease LptG
VLRLPDLPLPRPRLLDLYIGRRYLNVIAVTFVGLLGLYYIGTFIDKTERLFKGQASLRLLAEYFYYSTPQFVVHIVPMAILVSVLATIGGLTRTGELIVMRACGVSLYRAAVPLLLLSLLWTGALFVLDDRVLAQANRRADALEDVIRGNPPRLLETNIIGTSWLAARDGRIYYYAAFDPGGPRLQALSIFEIAHTPFRLASHTFVERAVFSRGAWHGQHGWLQRFGANTQSSREVFDDRVLPVAPPDDFPGMRNADTDLMTFGQLRDHIRRLAQSGFSLAESRVTLQERIAFPMVTLVMTILGIPFGLTIGRRGALYGVGLAIIIGALYWFLNTFFVAIGEAGLLRPVLAAWAANVLFLALAAYMTLTVRT